MDQKQPQRQPPQGQQPPTPQPGPQQGPETDERGRGGERSTGEGIDHRDLDEEMDEQEELPERGSEESER